MAVIDLLFWINVSLITVHEMDAVKNREWRMFAGLNRLNDTLAGNIFIAAHIPLYAGMVFILTSGSEIMLAAFAAILDVFLVFHFLLHSFFEKHKNNLFTSAYSKGIIMSGAFTGAVHLLLFVL